MVLLINIIIETETSWKNNISKIEIEIKILIVTVNMKNKRFRNKIIMVSV